MPRQGPDEEITRLEERDSTAAGGWGNLLDMDWIYYRWPRIAGWLAVLIVIGEAIHFVITLGGDVDFVVTRAANPGWVGKMTGYLLNPPLWTLPILLVFGLGLIWWDVKRPKNWRRPYKGFYPAKLVFDFDRHSGKPRRLENYGVERFYIAKGDAPRYIFLSFERRTGTGNVVVMRSENTNKPLRYDVLDRSDRNLVVKLDDSADWDGFTIFCENPRDTTKPSTV